MAQETIIWAMTGYTVMQRKKTLQQDNVLTHIPPEQLQPVTMQPLETMQELLIKIEPPSNASGPGNAQLRKTD